MDNPNNYYKKYIKYKQKYLMLKSGGMLPTNKDILDNLRVPTLEDNNIVFYDINNNPTNINNITIDVNENGIRFIDKNNNSELRVLPYEESYTINEVINFINAIHTNHILAYKKNGNVYNFKTDDEIYIKRHESEKISTTDIITSLNTVYDTDNQQVYLLYDEDNFDDKEKYKNMQNNISTVMTYENMKNTQKFYNILNKKIYDLYKLNTADYESTPYDNDADKYFIFLKEQFDKDQFDNEPCGIDKSDD